MEAEETGLVALCLGVATETAESVERWRRQRRTLERLPFHLAEALFRRLRRRRLLFPSLLEVFQMSVEDVDLKGEGCVDAEWMAYLGGFRYLRSLNLADCKAINSSALWSISGMTTLKELDLSRCSKVTDVGIKHLLSITSLEKLYIPETKLTDNRIISCFKSLENLRVLDLGGLPINDEALCSLQVLKHLEHLDLWGSRISDKGASTLKAFPQLSFLNVAWTDVHRLPGLPSISFLNMSFCKIYSICDDGGRCSANISRLLLSGAEFSNPNQAFSGLQASFVTVLDLSQSSLCDFNLLTGMGRLEHLILSSSWMTDDSVAKIACIGTYLKDLDLSKTKITSLGISILVGNVPNLQVLSLSHTAVDDSALPYFGMMPSLKKMDLSYTNISGTTYCEVRGERVCTLTALKNLEQLESLDLQGIQLADDTSHTLLYVKQLKSLYLKSDNLTDVSFHMLSRIPNLEFLGFCGTVLTDAGLLLFQPPCSLQKLYLRGCWLLTEDALSLFCKQNPCLEVWHELLPTYNANQITPTKSSQVHGSFQPRQMWSIRGKSSLPPRLPMTTFMDERLKYNREELLRLQHSPPSDVVAAVALPDMLKKEELE